MKRLAWLVVLCACGKPPSEAECRAMLDRYVDMTIDGDPEIGRASEATRPAIREVKKEKKKAEDAYKQSLTRCTAEVSRREYDCAMKSPNPNQWEACF